MPDQTENLKTSEIADAAIMLTFTRLHFLTPAEKVKAMEVTS
jgi:hypothetical protein